MKKLSFKKFVNIILVDFLWVLCSIPVITIGAATCAAYYVLLKIMNDEDVNVGKMFFSAFKQDFLQGTVSWIFTVAEILCFFTAWKYIVLSEDRSVIVVLILIVLSFLSVSTFIYTFALISHYKNELIKTIRNSMVLCLQFYKYSFKLLCKLIIICALCAIFIKVKYIFAIPVAFIGPILFFYTTMNTAKKIFYEIENPKVYDESDDESDDENDEDDSEEIDSDNSEEDSDVAEESHDDLA